MDNETNVGDHKIIEMPAVVDPTLRWFDYSHLPAPLQAISSPFKQVASILVGTLTPSPERTAALRKLLESKDCAVRGFILSGEVQS